MKHVLCVEIENAAEGLDLEMYRIEVIVGGELAHAAALVEPLPPQPKSRE